MAIVGVTVVRDRERSREARQRAAAQLFLDDGVLRTVILGDSLARGAGDEMGLGIAGFLDRRLRSMGLQAAVENLGINGARTLNVRRLLRKHDAQVVVRTADVVVISIGGNDLYGDAGARLLASLFPAQQQKQAVLKVEKVVQAVRKVNPAARVYVLGLYNPYRRSSAATWLRRQVNLWDARLITRFAVARDVTVVRICDLMERSDRISKLDNFHPGAAGYAEIADRLAASM